MTVSAPANGYILGWSVAWPPGPINAEMIRRGLLPKDRGGGFWSAWPIGLGACTGDFIWAFGVSVGAGAPAQLGRDSAGVSDRKSRTAFISRGSFRHWGVENLSRSSQCRVSSAKKRTTRRFLIWSFVVLMSPWNVGFWLAVIGSQPGQSASVRQSLAIAVAVVLGALT